MKKNHEITIDEAIETLDRFVEHQEKDTLLSLEDFRLQNGVIQVKELSKLEATLACFMEGVSKQKRLEKQREKKKIQANLLRSLDAIQIALVKLAHCGELNHELETRLQTIAHRYNNVVSRAEIAPENALQKVKYFFYKSVGWLFDEELLKSRIRLPTAPHTRKYSTQLKGATSKKVASLVGEAGPLKQEIELFFAKAHTLLRQQNLPQNILRDALTSIRSHPIETSVSAEALVSMQLPLSLLPGEELLMVGAFSRKQAISVPIKESFKIIAKATQTGYPHPLQSTGFAFSELLLPPLLLRPYLAPAIDQLLKKKQMVADALMPDGRLNEKAKAQLQLRKELFHTHATHFLPQQEAFCIALFGTPQCPPNINALIDEVMLAIRDKWLEGALKTKSDLEELFAQEAKKLPAKLGEALQAIGLLIYSEKIGYEAGLLDPFSKKVLAVILTELQDFIYELEEIPANAKEMEAWLSTLIEKKARFMQAKELSHLLANELESYYVLRSFR